MTDDIIHEEKASFSKESQFDKEIKRVSETDNWKKDCKERGCLDIDKTDRLEIQKFENFKVIRNSGCRCGFRIGDKTIAEKNRHEIRGWGGKFGNILEYLDVFNESHNMIKKEILDDLCHMDDECIIIKDRYPKSQHHLLVIPRKRIEEIVDLTTDDIQLLYHMRDSAHAFIKTLNTGAHFKLGFHCIPSNHQLHMHIISNDHVSTYDYTLENYNAFTSCYFVSVDILIENLERFGWVFVHNLKDTRSLLYSSPKCHLCGQEFEDISELKKHLVDYPHL